jgi:hypothetical protein
MGFAKRQLEEAMEWHASLLDKVVCTSCLYDGFLKRWAARSKEKGECSYCGKQRRVRDMDALLDLVREGIGLEWTDAVNELPWDGEEGAYFGENHNSYELVSQCIDTISEYEEIIGDIALALPDKVWCPVDPFRLSTRERLIYGWQSFQEHVTHKQRFFFHGAALSPDDEEGMSVNEWMSALADAVRRCALVVTLPAGTLVHRARESESGEAFSTAGQLGTCPAAKAVKTHRMSPPGIPLFYGSFEKATAIAEARQSPSLPVYVGTFRLRRNFRVLDLCRIPSVPSLYDRRNRAKRPFLAFLREFAENVGRPIARDDRVHLDYIPTQVVSEFFRCRFKERDGTRLDGILYPSAAASGGRNAALFVASEACVDATSADGLLILDSSGIAP